MIILPHLNGVELELLAESVLASADLLWEGLAPGFADLFGLNRICSRNGTQHAK